MAAEGETLVLVEELAAMAEGSGEEEFGSGSSGGGASIDVIPDSVISSILSKLVEARRIAQAATVCRRWRYSTTGVHVLRLDFFGDFDHRGTCGLSMDSDSSSDISGGSSSCSGSDHHRGDGAGRRRSTGEMLQIYSRMLERCSGLRELLIDRLVCRSSSSEQLLCSWAANLRNSLEVFHFRGRFDIGGALIRALSACPKLRSLELVDEMGGVCGCQCSKFEIDDDSGAILFPNLRRCVFQDMLMTDAKLEKFVSLCPVLEDLEALHLFGLEAPSLAAATLLHLKLMWKPKKENCYYVDETPLRCLKLLCPSLASLAVDGVKEVHLDGATLVELRALCYFKPVFKRAPSLKVLELASKGWTTIGIYQFLDMAKQAREISMRLKLVHHHRKQPISFPDLLEGFTELRTLKIGLDMFEALQVGNMSKSLMQSPPPLEDVTLVADSGNKNTISLLASILECDTLSSLRLSLLERPSGTFCTSLLKLQSRYHKVSIVVDAQDTDDEDDESEYEDDLSFSDADNDEDDEDDEGDEEDLDEDDYEAEETPTESETDYEDLP